ncbi:uncharacterized protein ACB058_005815 [Synchiropus picturatus]
MLELCRARDSEAASVAVVRVHRWAGVIRDYKSIRDNVLSCPTLMARTHITLYEVNQRTLSSWYNERSKAAARETVHAGAAPPSAPRTSEALPAARSLLPEAVQPDRPMQHILPRDESGLAVTRRGPLAPGHFKLAVQQAGTPSSSLASPTAAGPSTAGPSTAGPSTAGPSTAGPSTSSTAATGVSRTTRWRWKVLQEKARLAQEDSSATPNKARRVFNCSSCGQPRTRATGHSRYKKLAFCSNTDGRTVEQWHVDMAREEASAEDRL